MTYQVWVCHLFRKQAMPFYKNEKELKHYYKAVQEGYGSAICKGVALTDDDTLRAAVIKQLICQFELDIPAIEKQFNINHKLLLRGTTGTRPITS